jgi:hypothetical protein
MEPPNWAEILGGISAAVAAVATLGGVIVAGLAVKYAREAAREARRQAEASLESVRAAQAQVTLLEKQISLSEPKPVLVLNFVWTIGSGNTPTFEVENVGEELGFDVEVSDITIVRQEPRKLIATLHFFREPLVRLNPRMNLRYEIKPSIETPQNAAHYGQGDPELRRFLEKLVEEAINYGQTLGIEPNQRFELATINLTYKNVRGRSFSTTFKLTVIDERRIECGPEIS